MPQRDLAKERYWRRLLDQWRRSGLMVRAFCFDRGVKEASFYAWRREIDRRDRQKLVTPKKAAAPSPGTQSVGATFSTALPFPRRVTPAFVKLALDAGTTLPPAIEVVVADRCLLRVRPGFNADLLRQLVRLLEEPLC